jgi:hypothetical protein
LDECAGWLQQQGALTPTTGLGARQHAESWLMHITGLAVKTACTHVTVQCAPVAGCQAACTAVIDATTTRLAARQHAEF